MGKRSAPDSVIEFVVIDETAEKEVDVTGTECACECMRAWG